MSTAETLPCGCVVDTVGDAFVMQPCSPDCEYYRYAMEQAGDRPVRYIADPEVGHLSGVCPHCGHTTRIERVNPLGVLLVGCVNPLCPSVT